MDVALVEALYQHPRAGDLELSRLTKVARATVQSRLLKLQAAGIIVDFGPRIDLAAAGHSVLAFVTLEIAQGSLEAVTAELTVLPNVLEAYVTTGTADVFCKIAATSHEDLQEVLLKINQSASVVRSVSVIVLSELVGSRALPMLRRGAASHGTRAPSYRKD